ncbi:hypothetical protein [Candidatus Endomicrobiellum agilis]|uniref:hypothetical protein n=1 Tax=Candidatus Endomicrobiellum agilis TaxID=3238957 RepID=UPI00358BBEBE|nr:hypothetical protein [Endomicrobium sp.]
MRLLSRIILVCLISFLFISCQSHVHNNGAEYIEPASNNNGAEYIEPASNNNGAEYIGSAPVKFRCGLPSCGYVFGASFEGSIGSTNIGALVLTIKNIKNLISTSGFSGLVDKFPSPPVFLAFLANYGFSVLADTFASPFFLVSFFANGGFSELVTSTIPTAISASAIALLLTAYHWCYMKVWRDETKCQAQK